MSCRFPELDALKIEVSQQGRRTHLAAIADEIKAAPPRPTRGRAWSRRVAAIVVALAVSLPVAAIASERAVPGDLLYPIKEAVEPLWAIVDPAVGARHRIDELEVLVDARAERDIVDRQIDRARDALTDLEAPDLDRRLDLILDRLPEELTDGASTDVDVPLAPDEPRDTPATTQPVPDEAEQPADTTTPRDRRTTTTAATDSDRPPPSDRPPNDG